LREASTAATWSGDEVAPAGHGAKACGKCCTSGEERSWPSAVRLRSKAGEEVPVGIRQRLATGVVARMPPGELLVELPLVAVPAFALPVFALPVFEAPVEPDPVDPAGAPAAGAGGAEGAPGAGSGREGAGSDPPGSAGGVAPVSNDVS
jgi:hypothetical protein